MIQKKYAQCQKDGCRHVFKLPRACRNQNMIACTRCNEFDIAIIDKKTYESLIRK